MTNVGMIGLGKMGRFHMMNCLQIDDINVVAAADPSERARAFIVVTVFVPFIYTWFCKREF